MKSNPNSHPATVRERRLAYTNANKPWTEAVLTQLPSGNIALVRMASPEPHPRGQTPRRKGERQEEGFGNAVVEAFLSSEVALQCGGAEKGATVGGRPSLPIAGTLGTHGGSLIPGPLGTGERGRPKRGLRPPPFRCMPGGQVQGVPHCRWMCWGVCCSRERAQKVGAFAEICTNVACLVFLLWVLCVFVAFVWYK